MADLFPTASDLRTRKKKSITVHEEVSHIQTAILAADELGDIEITIEDSLMTTPATTEAEDYYKAWKEIEEDRLKVLEMDEVIKYFVDRGYSTVRKTNPSTENTFYWELKW